MRLRPRLRTTGKWTGVLLSAMAAGYLAFSYTRCTNWTPAPWLGVRSISGATIVVYMDPPTKIAGHFSTHPLYRGENGMNRWYPAIWHKERRWEVTIPIWMQLLLFAVPTALLWRSDHLAARRAGAGRCPKCGYDRRGLVGGADAKCPECGTVPVPTAPK